MIDNTYISLDVLAIRLGLPLSFLREQVQRGTIPFLRINRWLRFDEAAVRVALLRLQEAKQ